LLRRGHASYGRLRRRLRAHHQATESKGKKGNQHRRFVDTGEAPISEMRSASSKRARDTRAHGARELRRFLRGRAGRANQHDGVSPSTGGSQEPAA